MKITRFVSLAMTGLFAVTGAHAQSSLQLQSWMSPEVADAWKMGFKGSGTTITVVDDFRSNNVFNGNLGQGTQRLRHGDWTLKEASMVAPGASVLKRDFSSSTTVGLLNSRLNVLNLSYGILGAAGYTASQIGWSSRERSIINYAQNGRAVISKAAGNDAVAIGSANASGKVDYLNLALKAAPSGIFVGALSTNGTVMAPATLAYYSNTPGTDPLVQQKFVVVGVEGAKTGLRGTSFAAPIISGYAAILGSKFTRSSPTQITNQLLNTARQDTIAGYNPAIHGRGEASITRALAPVKIQ